MRSRSSTFCLALFLFIPSLATQTCSESRSANCCENNSTIQADSSVSHQPPTSLNCSFEGNLCSFRQGCVDKCMEPWSTNDSYATVRQNSTTCGSSVYSILESPWVKFTTRSCIEFTYSRGLPYQLQVFLAFSNGAQPCLMEDSNDLADKIDRTARFSIEPMAITGKIQFRVLGGGQLNSSLPKLDHVTLLEGRCEEHDGQFKATPRPTSTQCTHVPDITTSSSTSHCTTSDPTGPTSSTDGNMTSPDGESTASPTHTSTQPMKISVTTTSSPLEPNSASDKIHPTMFSPDGDKSSPDGESGDSAAAIAGVVVTVVVLIVVIIVVVLVCRRKRRQSKADNESRIPEDLSMSAGGTTTRNATTERRGNPFSRRDGDYTDIDLATTPSSDINPYELADDGTNTNGSLGLNLQRLNGSKEDDYSRIDEAQPAAAHSEKNTTPERPNPYDVYSVVNKPGKKTPTPEYSLAKIVGDKPTQPNPKDVYSVVNKKGKKFEPAAKPGEPDTEYNTISHNGNNTSSQKAPGDATFNPYNRIGAVSSIGLNENSRASTKPEDGLLSDDYNKLNLAGNGSMKEKSGAAGAAYDHVCNDPDDAYSKARIGKRYVVIDSDYHRLKP